MQRHDLFITHTSVIYCMRIGTVLKLSTNHKKQLEAKKPVLHQVKPPYKFLWAYGSSSSHWLVKTTFSTIIPKMQCPNYPKLFSLQPIKLMVPAIICKHPESTTIGASTLYKAYYSITAQPNYRCVVIYLYHMHS